MCRMTDQMDTSSSTAFAAAATARPSSNGRIPWPKASSEKQIFSLPDNIIYYMAQNPLSPEAYSKLAQCCKYFFEKKPLLIIARINSDTFCSSKNGEECDKNNEKCCIKIDLAKLTSKIWLTHQYIFYNNTAFNALLSQKIYKCENALFGYSFNRILFENFVSLASFFEKFYLMSVEIIDKNGTVVMLEQILGSLPNVKKFIYIFRWENPAATAFTMKNICKLGNLDDLRIFRLENIPEACGVKDLEYFIMNHKNTKFWLHFRGDVSEEYKAELDDLCNTVVKSEVLKCFFQYGRQDKKKLAIMHERYFK